MLFRLVKNVSPIWRFVTPNLIRNASTLTRVEYSPGIKKITMIDHQSRNALSLAMMHDLLQNIQEAEHNQELRAIVLAAEGKVFSSGHNMKELTPEAGRSQREKVFELVSQLMYSIIDSPVPVIAQVHGIAAAAGCQLVAQCDIVVCTENSQFSTPGVNFGIFCSTPAIPLARTVQKSTALNMLFTGQPITAVEARNSGLVTKVCSSEHLDEEVRKICDAIIAKSRAVVALGKKFYYKQANLDIKHAYALGVESMLENLELVDAKEGIRSFIEKRKPMWTHKNEYMNK